MNVIVIIADSLRRDHLGCYGNSWIRTPHIDQFATECALFDEAYSEGLPTLPTRTAWWTGRFTFPFRGWQPFELSDALLAEVLWSRGYTTALITDVYHMHKPGMNCGRGWDTVRFIRGQEYDPYIVDPRIVVDLSATHKLRGDDSDALWRPRFEQYLRNCSVRESEEDYFVAQVVRAGIEWLEAQRKNDRLFLWLDCFDPHEPWDPPAPFDTLYDSDYQGVALIDPVPGPVDGYLSERELQHVRALYAGEVSFVDKWIGIFLDAVRRLGLMENTLIVFTADHGEPLGEHGFVRKARPENWEELVHIPLLIRHPDGLGARQRVPAIVETCDLMPTILDVLGIEGTVESPLHQSSPPMHGKSLLPLLQGEAETVRDYAYIGHHRRSWNIRNAEWSYHLWLDGRRAPCLFHRPTDPGEQHNVLPQNRAIGDSLELELRRFVAQLR